MVCSYEKTVYGILLTLGEEQFLLDFKTSRKSLNFKEELLKLLKGLGKVVNHRGNQRGKEASG